jgi:hypothetical protein
MVTKMVTPLSFEDLARIEPRLKLLERDVKKAAKAYGSWEERTDTWYRDLKPRLVELAGYCSTSTGLQSSKIYDLCYERFIDILKI